MLRDFRYVEMLNERFHAPLRHYNVDLIDTSHKLDGYRVVFSPFLTTIDADLQTRMEAFVSAGGTWIAGPMTGFLTEDTVKFSDSPYPFVERLAGVYTKYQKPIANTVWSAVWQDGTDLGDPYVMTPLKRSTVYRWQPTGG